MFEKLRKKLRAADKKLDNKIFSSRTLSAIFLFLALPSFLTDQKSNSQLVRSMLYETVRYGKISNETNFCWKATHND